MSDAAFDKMMWAIVTIAGASTFYGISCLIFSLPSLA